MSAARRRGEGSGKKGRGGKRPPGGPATTHDERTAEVTEPTGLAVLAIPAGLALTLLALTAVPRVAAHPVLVRSFQAAALALGGWTAVLFVRLRAAGAGRGLVTILRPQHWLQSTVQLSVLLYWGWYWRPVYEMAWLFAAQIAFAYALDMLLAWSRRARYTLGFGPFPIIFSINLFLWFRDDWFYLQFLMIGVGFLGKELIRWNRAGRSAHIFNPSAFALGLFSLMLIVTGTTDLTFGPEIAATLTLAPRIYLFLFLGGLVVMYFFSITLVAGSAAAVLFGLSALYYQVTGVPYFVDSEIPAAVFLGLHLLVTDPSTSPRSLPGKAMFGALYGVGVFALYALLGALGAPTFYDKLLCVPLLNLSVRWIDRTVARLRERGAWPDLAAGWTPARLNLAYMGAWIVLFGAMTATDRTDGRHVGDAVPFWERACAEDRRNACERLLQIEASYCGDASAWACNELGGHYARGEAVEADARLARDYFARACELRHQGACLSLLEPGTFARLDPRPLDLRLMLREAGRNLMDTSEPELYTRACTHDWTFACERVAGTL